MSAPEHRSRTVRLAVTASALVLLLAGTAWWVRSDFRYMRIRNSLLFDVGGREDFTWRGDAPPAGFLVEQDAPEDFRSIVREVAGSPEDAVLERAKRLARHLAEVSGSPRLTIQDSTVEAYRGIREGRGNCSDFSQVFAGMAEAIELPVREWGLFFYGFGGQGHSFNEVWEPRTERWIFVDTFKSFYVTDGRTGEPLSVLEFRDRLLAGQGEEELSIVPYYPERPMTGLRRKDRLIAYYRRGFEHLGLWYANDVFAYDAHPLVRFARVFPPAVEQAITIVAGVHPRLRILATPISEKAIATMVRERNVFFALVALAGLLSVALGIQLRASVISARARRPPRAGPPVRSAAVR